MISRICAHLNISNLLSLARAPLALLFLPDSMTLRLTVVFLAAFTDYLDGYLARRLNLASQVGAVLDPIMDKIFMFFVIGVLVVESQLGPWEGLAMVSREILLAGFGTFLFATGSFGTFKVKAINWGKILTFAQYIVLGLVVIGVAIPTAVYTVFPLLAFLFLIELCAYFRSI